MHEAPRSEDLAVAGCGGGAGHRQFIRTYRASALATAMHHLAPHRILPPPPPSLSGGESPGKTTFAFVLELRTACIAVGCTSSIKLPSCAMHSHLPGFGRTLPCTLPIRCATSHASPDLLEAPSLPFRSCPFTPPYHPYAPSLSSLTKPAGQPRCAPASVIFHIRKSVRLQLTFGGRGCMNRSPRDPPSTRGIQLPERESWCEVCEVCVAEGSVQILVPVVPQGKGVGGKDHA